MVEVVFKSELVVNKEALHEAAEQGFAVRVVQDIEHLRVLVEAELIGEVAKVSAEDLPKSFVVAMGKGKHDLQKHFLVALEVGRLA